MTKAQAKELFRSVDDILHFASDDSKLPVKHEVKRKLQTRASVEKYVIDKFNDDEDAKRMQRSEIVLKKFGLLDRDFQLKPFLISLLTEQIAGYYDSKTKTVNLLDWIAPDSQKPVLAHELTHALQDQYVNLDKWEDQSLSDISKNYADDNKHIAVDEVDTAREAVLEGQAMAVFVDYSLKPSGKTLLTSPDIGATLQDNLSDNSDSPIMARAPLLLQESLLFPYREGLNFEQALMKDKGIEGAFAGVLDRPPSTSFEIMNPKSYERKAKVPLLQMPDIHGLLDAQYDPYDIGVMGALGCAYPDRVVRRPGGCGRADSGVGWRYLLCGAEQSRQDSGTEGANQLGRTDVPIGLERSGGGQDLCRDLCRGTEQESIPA